MISAIRWVSELIEVAGGTDIFSERSAGGHAKDRIVTVNDVVEASPDIMLASWCGKPLDREAVLNRPGMSTVPAVAAGRIYEVPPEIILQPGPACLTDGLDSLEQLIHL